MPLDIRLKTEPRTNASNVMILNARAVVTRVLPKPINAWSVTQDMELLKANVKLVLTTALNVIRPPLSVPNVTATTSSLTTSIAHPKEIDAPSMTTTAETVVLVSITTTLTTITVPDVTISPSFPVLELDKMLEPMKESCWQANAPRSIPRLVLISPQDLTHKVELDLTPPLTP